DYDSLLEQLDGRVVELKSGTRILHTKNAELVRSLMSGIERFLHTISDPNIAYILFLAGMYGIIFELSNPGAVLPGVIGGICILLSFWSFHALSLSATGVALIIFAIILFIADVKAPTHGILTVGGIISLFLGSLMLINAEKEPFVRMSLKVITSATVATALFFIFAVGMAVKTHRKKPTTGIEGMIGLIGTAKEDLDPEGGVFVRGERWKARAKEGTIKANRKIKVVGIDNLTLIVEEAK
ncbi:MAG: nodulation protein NfeD, partial [Candidatus Hydrothermarchaeaceae archaeon]